MYKTRIAVCALTVQFFLSCVIANNNKFLSDFGIRNGSRLQADDFLQDYTLLINVLHTYVTKYSHNIQHCVYSFSALLVLWLKKSVFSLVVKI